jgi:hypothetical protein
MLEAYLEVISEAPLASPVVDAPVVFPERDGDILQGGSRSTVRHHELAACSTTHRKRPQPPIPAAAALTAATPWSSPPPQPAEAGAAAPPPPALLFTSVLCATSWSRQWDGEGHVQAAIVQCMLRALAKCCCYSCKHLLSASHQQCCEQGAIPSSSQPGPHRFHFVAADAAAAASASNCTVCWSRPFHIKPSRQLQILVGGEVQETA